MGSSIILAGHYKAMNFVAGSSSVANNTPLSVSTPIASGFQLKDVADGELGTITRLTLPDNDIHYLAVDLNKIVNGGMENWTRSNIPDEWINRATGGATITQETSIVHTGASSAKFTNASGTARMRQRRYVRPNDPFTISVALRGDGTNTISAFCSNPNTGRFLNSSGVWVDTPTAFATRSTASFAVTTVTGTVESFSKCQAGSVKLVFEVEQGGATGVGYVDEFRFWPHWNFAAVLGSNVTSTPAVSIQSDDNISFSSPTGIALSGARSAKWAVRFTNFTDRYARIALDGSGLTPIGFAMEFGEWIISRAESSVATGIRIPMKINYASGGSGDRLAATNEIESTEVGATLPWINHTDWESLRLQVGSGSRFGGHPSILIPVGPDDIAGSGMAGSEEELYFGNLTLNKSRVDHDGKYELSGGMSGLEFANHVK